jgi:phytoene desaturase
MAHIDFHMGVWYPEGGFGKIVDALADLGKEHNVTYVLNEPVTKVIVEDGKAVGVKTALHEYRADIVIMNADYHHGETVLLDKKYQAYPESYWKKATIAPSGFIMYIGLDKKIDGLSHHNLFLDNDWIKHFDTIFESPSWPDYPSYYVSCPSKTDASVAPDGKENIFVLVPVAAGLDDSDKTREAYGEKILSHLETLLGEKIKDHIIVKKLFTHRDFSSRYNAYKGTALGLTHSLFQSAWFRPRHKSSKVKNLFYTGAYTHPGIGVPMQLVNAEILAKVISD